MLNLFKMATVMGKWDFKQLVELYMKSIENNILKRARKVVFEGAKDEDLAEYKFRRHDEDPYIFKFDKFNWYIPSKNENLCLIIENYSKDPFFNGIKDTYEKDLIKSIMVKMYESNKAKFYKLFLEPLLAKHTVDLFNSYSNFTYVYSKYSFNPDIPLGREIILKSREGEIFTIHKHVAVSTGGYLPKIILDENFKPQDELTLDADSATIKWFIEQTYTGVFVFDDTVDNLAALHLLDFLLVETKATLLDLFVKSISK